MSDDWKIRFGTAGTSDSFAAQGYKTSLEVPEYTAKMGLNAFEYQCGRGVRLGLDKAAKMRRCAGRWAENASSSIPAAAASRAGKRPLKKRWTPCAVPWKHWMRRALPT